MGADLLQYICKQPHRSLDDSAESQIISH